MPIYVKHLIPILSGGSSVAVEVVAVGAVYVEERLLQSIGDK